MEPSRRSPASDRAKRGFPRGYQTPRRPFSTSSAGTADRNRRGRATDGSRRGIQARYQTSRGHLVETCRGASRAANQARLAARQAPDHATSHAPLRSRGASPAQSGPSTPCGRARSTRGVSRRGIRHLVKATSPTDGPDRPRQVRPRCIRPVAGSASSRVDGPPAHLPGSTPGARHAPVAPAPSEVRRWPGEGGP